MKCHEIPCILCPVSCTALVKMDEAEIMEVIVEMAVKEVMHCILATKCCQWSKKKWNKIMGQVEHQREDRMERIQRRISQTSEKEKQDIMKYAVKITNI